MWFEAKVKNSFLDGPRHVLKQLELIRLQNCKVHNIVAETVARGAWYSHSEAVLQTLLCSTDPDKQKFAVEKIIKIRNGKDKGDLSNRPRVHLKTFNPKAKKLIELCSWDSNVFENVFSCSLTLNEIK